MVLPDNLIVSDVMNNLFASANFYGLLEQSKNNKGTRIDKAIALEVCEGLAGSSLSSAELKISRARSCFLPVPAADLAGRTGCHIAVCHFQ